LPVPLSPVTSTDASVAAARRIVSNVRRIAGLRPTSAVPGSPIWSKSI
jgi:hypothetical protein